jgi:hypothetical protein
MLYSTSVAIVCQNLVGRKYGIIFSDLYNSVVKMKDLYSIRRILARWFCAGNGDPFSMGTPIICIFEFLVLTPGISLIFHTHNTLLNFQQYDPFGAKYNEFSLLSYQFYK